MLFILGEEMVLIGYHFDPIFSEENFHGKL